MQLKVLYHDPRKFAKYTYKMLFYLPAWSLVWNNRWYLRAPQCISVAFRFPFITVLHCLMVIVWWPLMCDALILFVPGCGASATITAMTSWCWQPAVTAASSSPIWYPSPQSHSDTWWMMRSSARGRITTRRTSKRESINSKMLGVIFSLLFYNSLITFLEFYTVCEITFTVLISKTVHRLWICSRYNKASLLASC